MLACTYAFNIATFRENLEGRLVPLLVRVLGMKRFAKLIFSQGLSQIGKERGYWLAGVIANQDSRLMVSAWRAAMAFDSRRRLPGIACPTLIVAGSTDKAVPMRPAKMLRDGITDSELVVIDGGADHALIWTHSNDLGTRHTGELDQRGIRT